MNQSHRDRLISSLPADMQARVLKSLQDYSDDGNDAVEACFAAMIETNRRDVAQLREDVHGFREKLVQSEAREKQLAAQFVKSQAETQNTIKGAISDLSGDQIWKRGITKSIVNGIVWLMSVAAGSIAILIILLKTEIKPLKEIITPLKETIEEHRQIVKILSDDPRSLAAYAKYSKEASEEAVNTAISIHAISKLMFLPKMQMSRSDDGFMMIYGPKSSMPIGTTEDGRNWVKLANPVAYAAPDTTPAIDNAKEAEKKLKQFK